MRRISSGSTWWHKKAFPTLWFGFLGVFTLAWIPGVVSGKVPAPTLLIPLGMVTFGYFLMHWLIFSVVDEVFLDADQLVVRNAGLEERFPLSNIIKVEASRFTNPERIVLRLRRACAFGDKIAFLPPIRFWKWGRHPLAEELLRRVQQLD